MKHHRLTSMIAAAAVALAGCSSQEDTMTDQIREGLPDDSLISRTLEEGEVETREVDLPQLDSWRLAEVASTGERPMRWVVAYQPTGEARTVVLSGSPERWQEITAGADVQDATAAEQVATAWYDATRRQDELWYRAGSVDDIDWQPIIDEREVERLKGEYADVLTAPAATPEGDGWKVTVWAVEQRDLVRHEVTVGRDGSVRDDPTTVERAMPVSEAV